MQWQEKKYVKFCKTQDKELLPELFPAVKIQSCTASSALAKVVLMYTVGWTDVLDVSQVAGLLTLSGLPLPSPSQYMYDMTEGRNKFMAYCMVMGEQGRFSSDIFDRPAKIEHDDNIGEWSLHKVTMALCHPLMKEDMLSGNKGLVDKVVVCLKECDA